MNREEREEYVIQLWKAGRTVRDIAKHVHMSFSQIGAITNKVKSQADRERGYSAEEPQPKSDESRAFKLFSEGKSPVEVVIALDLPAQFVEAKYQEYWECKRMFELVQIYYEAKYDLHDLLRLHKIFKHLGMGEPDIHKVLELAKHNQLRYLQGKVEYLENEIRMLQDQKAKATNHILKLNKTTDEFEGRFNMFVSWVQQKGQVGYMNQEPRMLQGPTKYNAANLYPQPNTNWHSLDVSYTNHYWGSELAVAPGAGVLFLSSEALEKVHCLG
jgi:hypothetical protein